MSLPHYNRIQQHSVSQTDLLGMALPQLTSAKLTITTKLLTTDEMIQCITDFNPAQGWVMLRDEVLVTTDVPEHGNVIEAEYANDTNSLTIKLVANNQYAVVTFTPSDDNNATMVYHDQAVFIRNKSDKADHSSAAYRLWWQQEQSGANEGRWLPLAQQFIGFTNDKEAT